jgi:hypothetical protein
VPEQTLAARVENLERKTESLEALPARMSAVELQIVQLRTEMGEQFSVIRQEFAAADSGLREEIRTLRTDLRAELRAEGEAIRTGLRAEIKVEGEAIRTELRAEIKAEGEAIRTGLRAEIKAEGEAIRTELRAVIEAEGEVIRTGLRKEIRDGDEETRRYMRVLHEEVLSRMVIIQERLPRRRKR